MDNEAVAAIGKLLARSALLADVGQPDAASALLGRAVQCVRSLTDSNARTIYCFLDEWLKSASLNAEQLAPVSRHLCAAEDDPASMRSAIETVLKALPAIA